MSTALQKALDGQKLSDNQTKSALAGAVAKVDSLKGQVERVRERSENAMKLGLTVLEVNGATFIASAAAAAGGEKVTHPFGLPVDARAITGGSLVLWGLYDAFNGGDGSHQVALGTGIVASYASDMGRVAGEALAARWKGDAAAKDGAQPAQIPPVPQVDATNGPLRSVVSRRAQRVRA